MEYERYINNIGIGLDREHISSKTEKPLPVSVSKSKANKRTKKQGYNIVNSMQAFDDWQKENDK